MTDADDNTTRPSRGAAGLAARWSRVRALLRHHWSLWPVVALSTALSSWALGSMGWGNTYYSAAVRSMSHSWKAFFYGSIDSVGFVTVDKPPFSLWVQALVVRVVGFSQMALLVPQVIAGVGAVLLVYAVVVRRWGRGAATLGALALAISPISVMVSHSNNTDSILTFIMTATAWAGINAAERRSWRWTLAAAVLFGASFTTKMLAAAPVLPAVAVALLFAAGVSRWRRLAMTAGFTALAVVTALAWFTAVDLTPAEARPYVGSSSSNSAYQLAFERNGVNQVDGDMDMMGRSTSADEAPQGVGAGLSRMDGPGGGPGGMSGFSGGTPGAARLLNDELGSQIGWLVVPGLLGAVGAVSSVRRRRPWHEPTLVVPLVWFVGGAGVYSVTKGIVHPYYVASIAPPLAMLIGAGVGAANRRADARVTTVAWLSGALATSLTAWMIARRSTWRPAEVAAVFAVALTVAAIAFVSITRVKLPRSAAVGLLGLALLAPAVWTVGSLRAGVEANLPYADPARGARGGGLPGAGGPADATADQHVVTYLLEHRGTTDWLVATTSAMAAAPIIIETGEPVIALGGFSGSDPILDSDAFDELVAGGRVRYVLLGNRGGPGGAGGPGGNGLTSHITATCIPVAEFPASLYDCVG